MEIWNLILMMVRKKALFIIVFLSVEIEKGYAVIFGLGISLSSV